MGDLPLHVLYFNHSGAHFVFDERYPGPDNDTVSGYSENVGEARLYKKRVVVGNVSKCSDPEKSEALKETYLDWLKTAEGKKYEADAFRWKEQRISSAIERHRQNFTTRGEVAPEVLRHSIKKRRVTHCYRCKSHLDNSITPECSKCGWIICECGACGCFFEGQ